MELIYSLKLPPPPQDPSKLFRNKIVHSTYPM